MKTCKTLSFTDRIRWRNRGLRCLLLLMVIYMVVIGEMGWGDSRVMTGLANSTSRIIFFGGMIWVVCKIIRNKKLLENRLLMREKLRSETDERNRYLHDKSGGLVWDIMFVCLLFVTVTTALINMPAFYTAFALLCAAVAVKLAALFIYKKMA